MSADAPAPHSSQQTSQRRAGFRFSLKSLLGATTVFALALGLLIAIPGWLSQMLLGAIWIAITGLLITGIVFARGDQRAFCIGATVVFASMWTSGGGHFAGGVRAILQVLPLGPASSSLGAGANLQTWLVHVALVVAALANGWLCVQARRFFERQDEK